MTVPTDNPAGRLYALLQQAAEAGGFGRAKWRAVFEIPEGSANVEFEIVLNIIEMVKLVDEVELALLRINDGIDVAPFLATLPDIKAVLKRRSIKAIDEPYSDEGINKHILGLLGLASQLLSTRHREPLVQNEDLANLQVDVRELFEEVEQSGIDSELRIYILASLHEIDASIQRFRIFGPKGLQDALIRITGELHYRQEEITRNTSDPVARSVVDRFTSIIGKLDSLTRFADTGMKLIGTAKSATSHLIALLGPGSNS